MKVPNWREWDPLTLVTVALLVFGTVQLIGGALEVGVTTDEEAHVKRLDSWLEYGWYLPDEVMVDGHPDPANEFSSPFVYGPAFASLAHLANVLVGNESLGAVSSSAAAYDVRHLVVAALALAVAVAVGAAVGRLGGSRRIGLWAAAGLLALPRWTGQAFFNLKDVPTAAGYTLVTVALVFALCRPREDPPSRLRLVAVGATLMAGIYVGVGTRTSLWPAVGASLIGYVVLRAGQARFGGMPRRQSMDAAVAAGTAAGALAVAAIYTNASRTPLKLLFDSVSSSSEYPYEGFTLVAGRILPEHPPWWYLPVIFGGTTPLILGGLAVLGIGVALVPVTRIVRGRDRPAAWTQSALGAPLVLVQALLLPIAVVVKSATLYGGLRQHLYVLPAAAILAGIGAAWLFRQAASSKRAAVWRALVAAGLCLALIVPMVQQTSLFPYNYAYVNPAAAIGGVEDRWETDYWWASAPEALARVPAGVRLLCSQFLVTPWAPEEEPGVEHCTSDQFKPFEDLRGTEVSARSLRGDPEKSAWVIGRARGGNHPPPYCREVNNVTRRLDGEEVVMAFVLRCDPKLLPSPP